MIKPVTFQGAQNFKANLYALETAARFVDVESANGYYKGYGDELAATVIGSSGIRIGSGALLVQGRMVEIVSSETVNIAYEEGKVGYVICRIETKPSGEHCSLFARTGSTFSNIDSIQEDTYSYDAESENRTYELPLYSFVMQNGAIGAVTRVIDRVHDLTEITKQVYPVGSIYMSVNPTSPAALFGGTWAEWGEGRVPLGVDTGNVLSKYPYAELTGGEETHALTENELPAHSHQLYAYPTLMSALQSTDGSLLYAQDFNVFANTKNIGGDQPHNNMPPYITCYMWKRIA